MANRVVLGEFNGDYVLRVSRPGFNVLDPNLPRHQLAFDSRWPENLNIAARGTFELITTMDIPHGMTYGTGPVVLSWLEADGYIYCLDAALTQLGGGGNVHSYQTSVLPSVIRYGAAGGSGRPTSIISYYVLRNSNG